MGFRRVFYSVFLAIAFSLYIFSYSSAFNISPSQPVQGDVIKLTSTCIAGANVPVTLEFNRDITVSSGKYEYNIGTIEIPSGSTLSVRAENVADMKLGMKILIWFTLTVQGNSGVATYSTSLISGKRTLRVFGNSLSGYSVVKLKFSAKTNIKCDGSGNLLYSYDSRYLPLGEYTITVGSEKKTITLLAVGSTPTPSPSPTPSPTPPPKNQIVLVANDIDYSLSRDLLNRLAVYDLGVLRTSAPSWCTLILGGPDAYDGVGAIVQGLLNTSEQSQVRKNGSKVFYRKGRTFIVAGSDRNMTNKAFKESFVEVAANLLACVDEVSLESGQS